MWSDDAIPGVFCRPSLSPRPVRDLSGVWFNREDREEVYPPKKRQMPVRFALRSSRLSKTLNANPPLFLSLSGFTNFTKS